MITLVAERRLIACCVTSEMKARVRALANRDGITESTLVRQLLDTAVRTSAAADVPTRAAPERVSRQTRLYVRLAAEDWRLLKERASARGMAGATYVALLTRSHLRNASPLPKAEHLALKQLVVELTAIGRNLNQIARAMNQGASAALPGRTEVAAMLRVAEGLRDHVKRLLSANARTWGQGDG
jgi:predicted DNA binding CopG/RHH family protein